jgi:AmmeMemoRadiSam system protein A
MHRLGEASKQQLLALSRDALIDAANKRALEPIEIDRLPDDLRAIGTSFVTLREREHLRGCIGALEARVPLAEDVRQHTVAAALYDYRFPPVTAEETERISIEISVLTTPVKLEFSEAADLLDRLEKHNEGVIIQYQNRRATFLPQVWDRISDPTQFLSLLCEKAGLGSRAWETLELMVYVYQVEKIDEESG